MEDFFSFQLPILSMIESLERQLSLAKSFSQERTITTESDTECEIAKFVRKKQQRRKELTSLMIEILETEIALWKEELEKVKLNDYEDIYKQLLGGNKERFKQNMSLLLDDEKVDTSGIDVGSDKNE